MDINSLDDRLRGCQYKVVQAIWPDAGIEKLEARIKLISQQPNEVVAEFPLQREYKGGPLPYIPSAVGRTTSKEGNRIMSLLECAWTDD